MLRIRPKGREQLRCKWFLLVGIHKTAYQKLYITHNAIPIRYNYDTWIGLNQVQEHFHKFMR